MYKKNIAALTFLFLLLSRILPVVHAEDNDKFRFAVIGCMHLGACDSKDYELGIDKIKEYNPDFALFLGGMVDATGEKNVESIWQEFDHITSKLRAPVYNIIGNCRLTPLSIPGDRNLLMERCFLDRYKKRYYSFEYKNNLFICLDSDRLFEKNNSGLTTNNQIDFLNKTLAEAYKYDSVFIAMHGSPWIQDDSVKWFKYIHPLIKNKVKYVFGASAHYIDLIKRNNVTYVTTGVPTCYIKKSVGKPHFPHFLIVNVDNKNPSIEVAPLLAIPVENIGILKEEEIIDSIAPEIIKPWKISSSERLSILDPNRITKTLNIKPGMNILDIGAGTGIFTFRFADLLNGTGKVFATEIDDKMVEHIKNKIKEGKYKNIFPICVEAEGLDQFYKQHTFDIIFLSEVYQGLLNPKDYLRELRPSLNKSGGRLYIIHFKDVSEFSEIEFDDFKEVIKILIPQGKNSPILQRLSKKAQSFIKNWRGEDVPLEIQTKIIQDFNKMLLDRFLLNDLLNYYHIKEKTTDEYRPWQELAKRLDLLDIRLMKWLVIKLDENGYFDKRKIITDDNCRKELLKLNRILLTGIFQSDKLEFLKSIYPFYLEKNSIISVLESAGYKFVREYDFLTQYYFLEFKRRF